MATPGDHVDDGAQRGSRIVHDRQPDELEGVVGVVLERREIGQPHGELGSARRRTVESDRGAPATDAAHEHDLRRRAVDENDRPYRPAALVGARLLDDERAVGAVRAADPADRHEPVGLRQPSALVCDLEQEAPVAPGACRADDGAQRSRDTSLPADHLADVVGRDAQPEDDDVALVDALDPHGVGLVDEPARDPGEELVHVPTGCRRP